MIKQATLLIHCGLLAPSYGAHGAFPGLWPWGSKCKQPRRRAHPRDSGNVKSPPGGVQCAPGLSAISQGSLSSEQSCALTRVPLPLRPPPFPTSTFPPLGHPFLVMSPLFLSTFQNSSMLPGLWLKCLSCKRCLSPQRGTWGQAASRPCGGRENPLGTLCGEGEGGQHGATSRSPTSPLHIPRPSPGILGRHQGERSPAFSPWWPAALTADGGEEAGRRP